MKPRATLILVAVCAALIAFLYWVELPKTSEQLSMQLGTPTARPAPFIFQLDAAQVRAIDVTDLHMPRATQFTRSDQGWLITVPSPSKMADQEKAVAVLNNLTTLRATRVLTNVTDLAPFGFVTGTLEARVVMSDSSSFAITVGGKTPDDKNYYVTYTGDKSKVFIIESPLVESLKVVLMTPPYELPTPTPYPTALPTPTVAPTSEATATPKP